MEIKQKQEGVYPLNIELPSLKSLFIEMYFGEQLLSTGTATLISNTRKSHCALVTNRHNVTGRHQQTGECLSSTLGVPDNIVIHFHRPGENIGDWIKVKLPLYREDGRSFWIEHPILGEKADIVALNLNWGSDVLKIPYYLKLDLDRVGMLVSPAEPVSVIGFPFGMSTSGKLPVWATGFLAQELSLISEDNPVFLIDCRTRQGQSGSPVIAFRTSGYRTIKDNRISASLSGRVAWEFLGIYSGRVNEQSDLGRVWHVSALEELLNAAERVYKERNNKNDETIVK
ncbi:trypsin-like serine peptidase [Vibrio diazotrophicus]|uniref:trypsin-like serine peptidase n=1 Tax=Vibrio diazotrophicus TaxID=685 RepID=UPI00142D64F6|nr:trypsin-like peptidase domain-containing protein [Vibrio diazotrophicus]NIY91124.1 trypsin-like peptidase domain-containing protein [Vibrio diazotrophicus]